MQHWQFLNVSLGLWGKKMENENGHEKIMDRTVMKHENSAKSHVIM